MKICPLLFSLIFINCLLINSYAIDDPAIQNEPESEEDSEEVYELSDFVVSAEDDKGYFSANSTSITKANELVKNTPINVAIINEQLIEDLGIKTVEDLGKF
jgi:outer membrane receptor for ferric coprogen and ferric-rhodotorulic acid